MRYFGGKQRISKELAQFLNSKLNPKQPFIDLFCGSCNVVSKIDPNRSRHANDIHLELIAMWRHLQNGGDLPDSITEEDYARVRDDQEAPLWLKGFVGFGCSYSGKWWGGYARGGKDRNYCMNAKNGALKKIASMQDVIFTNEDYQNAGSVFESALIYCDIPYKDSTGYASGHFDHKEFYDWARYKQMQGNDVYVSEYRQNVPDGWVVVWEKQSKKDIRDANGIQQKTNEVVMQPPEAKS